MSMKTCEACNELRQDYPSLIVNGLTDANCTSLKNDTGLSSSVGGNDCDDLETMNDCFVGGMEDEVDLADVCDWKDFMKKLIGNLWTMNAAIICAICGIWENIHALWDEIAKIWAAIRALQDRVTALESRMTAVESAITAIQTAIGSVGSRVTKLECIFSKLGDAFTINIDGLTEAELGSGVEWRTSGGVTAYPSMTGNAYVLRINGSLTFTGSKWLNFQGNTDDGNWLVYRYKINKTKYKIKNIWSNTMMTNNDGALLCYAHVFHTGDTTPGQWGYDDPNNTYTVGANEIVVEVRVSNILSWGNAANTGKVTITGVVPILADIDYNC